ncbi:MAG TPA: hypothetical protein VN833_14735 [Candidatus Acidoferrales bacterium]|jgi:hypothetical protein|nr:hypothetical protein [Candidatus Acidoferrales bacterium]
MASLQALCSICGKTVTAFTIVSDKEIKLLLDSNQEVVVRHVFADSSGNRLDHRWRLGEETKNLRKLVDFMAGDKTVPGRRP